MPIDDQLLDILCCPETRQPVARAEASVLQPLNAEIEAGRLRNRGGDKVEKPIEEGLLREDGRLTHAGWRSCQAAGSAGEQAHVVRSHDVKRTLLLATRA